MKRALFFLSLFLFISCRSNESKNFADSLGELHGTQYSIAKENSLQEGFVVVKNEETGVYTAYDLSGYQKTMSGSELNSYLSSLPPEGKVTHLKKDIEEVSQTVTEWVDTSHYGYEWVYDEGSNSYVEQQVWVEDGYWDTYDKKVKTTVYKASNGLMFEESNSKSKDLEKLGSILEGGQEDIINSVLIYHFGFSEKRSKEVSKILLDIQKIQKKRSLTKNDLKRVSLSLFGVSFDFLKNSYLKGTQRERDGLIMKVAEFNGTDPESIKAVLKLTFSATL